MTRFFAISLAATLSGCGSMHWHKAGADDAELGKDLAACRSQAQARSGGFGLPPATMDPRFGGPSGPSQSDRMMQESLALDACMRQRGYVLVPS